MKLLYSSALVLFLILGPAGGQAHAAAAAADPTPAAGKLPNLLDARRGFTTRLIRKERDGTPIPVPPAHIFSLIRYDAPGGKNGAYLSPNPGDGKKHPAIIWLTGGDSNTIGEVWHAAPAANDQSAAAYRKAGIVMMFPSLRGGNDNPGHREAFLGEVDDILAAADHLARQDYVDPKRIYLGGHSTGGTLVLLAAASSSRFRAVFSFGPVADVAGYGPDMLPFDPTGTRELSLRAPGRWLQAITVPVFVIEGEGGNIDDLKSMAAASRNPKIQFLAVQGAGHFTVLAPVNRLIAEKIMADTGPAGQLAISQAEVNRPFQWAPRK
ncbi:MAG: prolyl oligopeptidase family serine peptidase [Pseudomonadota bacterium]